MEVKRKFIIEKGVSFAGYEITIAAEICSHSYIGRGGIYVLFEKRPVLAIMKSSSGTEIMTMDGKPLTASLAVEKVPGLKTILG